MGLPDSHRIPVSDVQAYKQFGNSVVVPMMRAIAKAMQPDIMELMSSSRLLAS
jgi:DNA (cytosine-5)-methyltransferase 1